MEAGERKLGTLALPNNVQEAVFLLSIDMQNDAYMYVFCV